MRCKQMSYAATLMNVWSEECLQVESLAPPEIQGEMDDRVRYLESQMRSLLYPGCPLAEYPIGDGVTSIWQQKPDGQYFVTVFRPQDYSSIAWGTLTDTLWEACNAAILLNTGFRHNPTDPTALYRRDLN